jgi:hypothetical protein
MHHTWLLLASACNRQMLVTLTPLAYLLLCCPAVHSTTLTTAEIGVDTTTVQRIDAPTRDIYVERTLDGDRVFAGFGLASDKYCDCFLDAEQLPKDILSVSTQCSCGCSLGSRPEPAAQASG